MQCDATRPSIITYNTLSGICTLVTGNIDVDGLVAWDVIIGFEEGRHGEFLWVFTTSTVATVFIHQM